MAEVAERKRVSLDDERLYTPENRQNVMNQLIEQAVLRNEELAEIFHKSLQDFAMYIQMTPHCFQLLPRHRKQLDGLYAFREAETPEQRVEALKSVLEVKSTFGEAFYDLKPGSPEYVALELESLEGLWLQHHGRLEFSL